MKHIFAPWRMEYIRAKKPSGCIFCDLGGKGVNEESLVVFRNEKAYVVLNRYPYVSGHLLVVPYRHVEHPLLLEKDEWHALNDLVLLALRVIEAEYKPHGFNVGFNVGAAAGAGIEEHIHAHVIPRWTGDNNLTAVLSETRVIPEALSETWKRVYEGFLAILGREGR